MEMKSLQMGTDWTYLFDNKAILGRATTIVDTQALRDAEAVIAQTMHGRRCRRDRHLSCSRPRPRRRCRQGGSGLLRGHRHRRRFLLTLSDSRSWLVLSAAMSFARRGVRVRRAATRSAPDCSPTGGLRESLDSSVGRDMARGGRV